MRSLLVLCCLTLLSIVFSLPASAEGEAKPGMVLLPIQGPGLSATDRDQFRAALAKALGNKYEVFSGDEVDKKLEKFAKKTCDADKCLQEMAIAYQASLIGRGIIAKEPDGYLITVEIRDIFSDKVEFSDTRGCPACGKLGMIDALKLLGSHAALVGAAARAAEGAAPVVADAESSLWEVIERANTIRDYEAYLAEYPQGRFAALARTRVKALIEEKLAQEEAALWKAVELTGKREDLQAYLTRFPEGRNAATASARLVAILKFEADTAVGRVFSDCPACPELVILPPGAFDMGSSDGDPSEQPMRRVGVEKFAIGRFEVTQAQWKAIMGQNPSRFVGCDDCPVEMVSWDEARSFVLALSVKTGRDYRLPSEAEWEYACRAGGRDPYCGGKDAAAVAWVEANSGGFFSTKARATGKLQGNVFKLHDMSGNVWEWVDDCWNDNHLGAPNDGKPRLDGDCGKRVLRGGSRLDDASAVRATKRHRDLPGHRDFVVGLRVAAAVVKR